MPHDFDRLQGMVASKRKKKEIGRKANEEDEGGQWQAEQAQEPTGGCVAARGAKELRNLSFDTPGKQWLPLLDNGLRVTVHQGIDAPMGV